MTIFLGELIFFNKSNPIYNLPFIIIGRSSNILFSYFCFQKSLQKCLIVVKVEWCNAFVGFIWREKIVGMLVSVNWFCFLCWVFLCCCDFQAFATFSCSPHFCLAKWLVINYWLLLILKFVAVLFYMLIIVSVLYCASHEHVIHDTQ